MHFGAHAHINVHQDELTVTVVGCCVTFPYIHTTCTDQVWAISLLISNIWKGSLSIYMLPSTYLKTCSAYIYVSELFVLL